MQVPNEFRLNELFLWFSHDLRNHFALKCKLIMLLVSVAVVSFYRFLCCNVSLLLWSPCFTQGIFLLLAGEYFNRTVVDLELLVSFLPVPYIHFIMYFLCQQSNLIHCLCVISIYFFFFERIVSFLLGYTLCDECYDFSYADKWINNAQFVTPNLRYVGSFNSDLRLP